ncbi:putative protein FAM221A [Triplophysa rosa]|uniref:Protein FAM221A n=1 Tax=Triplophysa rosa TaxID=992332 RepID=A0A9W7TKJ8_TRIRA|nr:putative protein FAM221A [Triplophysa rosa]
MERIRIDKQASNAVDAFLEYRRIVGEDDGGQLFSEDEFKKYKEIMLPRRMKNRLYVSFGVPGQIDCKLIGPETPCFCSHCSGYRSPFTCGCGQPGYAHVTLVETKEERMARGHPVGRDVPYAAMGGLTGFSSLADGYLRLDPSGIGPLSFSILKSDRLESDHVFERANTSLSQTAVVFGRGKDLRGFDDISFFSLITKITNCSDLNCSGGFICL